MTDRPEVDASGNWTAVQDQIKAGVRDFLAHSSDEDSWMKHAAATVRAELDRNFSDVEEDVLRRVLLLGTGLLAEIQRQVGPHVHVDDSLAVAQTTLAVALYGGDVAAGQET